MYTIYGILLFIAYFGILICCQGSGGGGSGGSGGGGKSSKFFAVIYSDIFCISGGFGGGGYYGGSACRGNRCRGSGGIIAGSVIGGIFGLILLIFGVIFCCACCKNRSRRRNSSFVNTANPKQTKQEVYEAAVFQSGIWSSRYFQYGKWHGPYKFSLSFDPQSMKVTGSGSDDVGTFTIDGNYSVTTSRIGLTKTYQAGTGNQSENSGHQVTIQLAWNAQNKQFEGKWYVQTSKYRGEDKFELKRDGQQQFSGYETLLP